MIARLHGRMISLESNRALIDAGPLTYEVLIPAADQPRLSAMVGEDVSLHTLHYLEGQGQGTSFVPRLIGFLRPDDRSFFELFTTVKGMGNRKALRALALPFGRVAQAIAERDVDVLRSLPEVGKKVAETILVELSGKVERFIEVKPSGDDAIPAARSALVQDVLAILTTQLGEPRTESRELIDRAMAADPTIESPDALLDAVYRLKA